jgi:hypothetical protein
MQPPNYRMVARVLELLRSEPDPLIDVVSRSQLVRADRYQLRSPHACKIYVMSTSSSRSQTLMPTTPVTRNGSGSAETLVQPGRQRPTHPSQT